MSRVIHDRSLCALHSAGEASEAQVLLRDRHDVADDAAATRFLLSSLSQNLREIISEKSESLDWS